MHLHLDFETRSRLDIKKVGLDNYARSAEAILLAWAIDDGPVTVWESFKGAAWNNFVEESLLDRNTVKVAWNSGFEQAIFRHCLGVEIPDSQWLDPAVIARYCSLPGHLAACGEALGLSETEAKQKAAGTRLINKFSKPTKTGEFRNQNTDPDDWKLFVEYCRQDVVAERNIFQRLKMFMLPEQEQRVYALDQKINARGLPVSLPFVSAAKARANEEKARLTEELKALTGLANPNSPKQLLGWLRSQGYPYQSIGATKIRRALTLQTDVTSDTVNIA